MISETNLDVIHSFCQYLGMQQDSYKRDYMPSKENISFIRNVVKVCQWGFQLKDLKHNALGRNRAIFDVPSKSKALRIMLANRAINVFGDKLVLKFKANNEVWIELV